MPSMVSERVYRSTVTPLLVAVNQWHQILENRHQAACVFFDFKKAFDSISHEALLTKHQNLQVPPIIFNWLADYLSS